MGEVKRQYETPTIIVEFDMEAISGTGSTGIDQNPLNNILLSESLGLDSPLH